MSVHSAIGILNADGSVSAVYCHNDGYPSGYRHAVGVVLRDHYCDETKVRDLIQLGDLSAVEEKVSPDPGVAHSFDHPQQDVTIAYHRDRGDDLEPARTFGSVTAYVEAGVPMDVEYLYLYEPHSGSWSVCLIYGFKRWILLER